MHWDECGTSTNEDVSSIVEFFEELGDAMEEEDRVQFRVFFSSRHYPHVTIQHGEELVLEGQEGHQQDINYCVYAS
jgi:hypothetical protein